MKSLHDTPQPVRNLSGTGGWRFDLKKVFFGSTLLILILGGGSPWSLAQTPAPAIPQARRLILKDGTYQAVTKYEVHGDRVRYFSAERGEWEEVPNALIDWDATDKFEQGRLDGKLAPEAAALDKELETERKAEQAKSPQVVPGLRLPDEGGIFLLDTYQNRPELVELQQSGGDVEKSAKQNVLRSAINPLGSAKQTIDLPEGHAKVQAHTTVPSVYINIDSNDGAAAGASANGDVAALAPSDRFRIIRLDAKGGKRVAGVVKTSVTGKTKTDERFVPTTATPISGGWVKLAPTDALPGGEYAVAEMLGKGGMNFYVWDFGVNPSAPANQFTWKPEPEASPGSDQPADLQKREKQ
jgi:hypothetical protein